MADSNAWYFRNALVRANYTNLQKGIYETTEYLEVFLGNLLLNEKNELHNRNLHISGLLNDEKDLCQKMNKNILIHGLGQNETSWDNVETELNKHNIHVEKPYLYAMLSGKKADYDTLLQGFTGYCNSFDGKLNLCGLSLGGILALDYAKKFPDKINSMILIGTPYRIPRFLFFIQKLIFHLIPESLFEKTGCNKKDVISLTDSMAALDIAKDTDKITCRTLILCGVKDKQNIDGARLFCRNIKGSSFQTVANSAHEVNVDNPGELSRMILDFWKND